VHGLLGLHGALDDGEFELGFVDRRVLLSAEDSGVAFTRHGVGVERIGRSLGWEKLKPLLAPQLLLVVLMLSEEKSKGVSGMRVMPTWVFWAPPNCWLWKEARVGVVAVEVDVDGIDVMGVLS
jgi:hypothetical protein